MKSENDNSGKEKTRNWQIRKDQILSMPVMKKGKTEKGPFLKGNISEKQKILDNKKW